MQKLEQCVDALLRLAVAEDSHSQREAKEKISELIKTNHGIYPGEETRNAESIIRSLMMEMGSPDHLLGHPYVIRGILLAVDDPKYINSITYLLYPTIAAEFSTTACRVERAIRHVIEVTWSRGDIDVLFKYFGNTIDPVRGRPSNGEFIARMANIVRMRLKER